MIQIKSYPRSLALTRLKSNLFFLFLFSLFRTIFTPWLSIRQVLIFLLDETLGFDGKGAQAFRWGEHLVSGLLCLNIAQAIWSLFYPPTPSPVPAGRTLTPSKPSSPLTRSYPKPKTNVSLPSPLTKSTSSSQSVQTPTKQLSQRNTYSTPSNTLSTPSHPQSQSQSQSRPSPMSASTASLLNLPHDTTPSKSGYYYQTIKKENGEEEIRMATTLRGAEDWAMLGASTGSAGGSEEREWVDNAWKGVRGKGGRVGL